MAVASARSEHKELDAAMKTEVGRRETAACGCAPPPRLLLLLLLLWCGAAAVIRGWPSLQSR